MTEFYTRLLDESGDTALTWNSNDDIEVLTFIQEKIDAGYVFFIEKPILMGAFSKVNKLSDVGDIKNRKLLVADSKAQELIQSGKLKPIRVPAGIVSKTIRKAKSAAEVASSQTIGVRPLQAG